MKMYITKWCLKDGIKHDDVDPCGEHVLHPAGEKRWFQSRLKIGRDCFRTQEEAAEDARKRREKKIASLKKQISKLEALEF